MTSGRDRDRGDDATIEVHDLAVEPSAGVASGDPPVRRRPGVLIAVAVLVVAALVAVLLVQRGGERQATPAPSDLTGPPVPGASAVTGLGPAAVSDIGADTDELFALQRGAHRLAMIRRGSDRPRAFFDVTSTATGVAVDPAGGVVWVLSEPGSTSTTLTQYTLLDGSPRRLIRGQSLTVTGHSASYAAWNGDLWLVTGEDLVVIEPGIDGRLTRTSLPLRTVTSSRTAVPVSVTADPSRERVDVVANNDGVQLWAVTVDGYGLSHGWTVRSLGEVLSLFGPSLAVTVGSTWLAGASANGPALLRIDPRDGAATAVAGALTSAGDISSGSDVMWLSTGDGLRCLADDTGGVLQQWPLLDPQVVSGPGSAYVASGGRLLRLQLKPGCAG